MSNYWERNPWTLWREQFEADPSDFTTENTVGEPTSEELANLPESVNLLDDLPRTYNQGSLGACTAYALTHIQLLQNCREFESALLELDPLSLWINMGHNPKVPDGWDYLENALKFSKSKWINGTGPGGKSLVFFTESYAYKNIWTAWKADFDTMKYYLSKWFPLYAALKWTSKTWRELSNGELVTVYPAASTTGWHAVGIYGIDNDYVYFANSWATSPKSQFKVSRANITEMVKMGMLNWRYWLVYDKKDIVTPALFEDYYKEKDTEEYKAVKRCKDNGIVKGSKGRLLPNEPLTREQMCLLLYRMSNLNNTASAIPVETKVKASKTK